MANNTCEQSPLDKVQQAEKQQADEWIKAAQEKVEYANNSIKGLHFQAMSALAEHMLREQSDLKMDVVLGAPLAEHDIVMKYMSPENGHFASVLLPAALRAIEKGKSAAARRQASATSEDDEKFIQSMTDTLSEHSDWYKGLKGRSRETYTGNLRTIACLAREHKTILENIVNKWDEENKHPVLRELNESGKCRSMPKLITEYGRARRTENRVGWTSPDAAMIAFDFS
jgi:hypothetical protein